MAPTIQPVRGTHDLMAADYGLYAHIVGEAKRIAELYGYHQIATPIIEFSEVFHRAVGETSDIVSKETYTFTDRGGESITLRPEFTAAVVRAFISNKLTQDLPFKCFYAGPAFRYERPQKGRQRQFHQFGVELLGAAEPIADVEIIALGMQVIRALGLSHMVTLELNSLGDVESRANYRAALVAYLLEHEAGLSDDSKTRLEKNPLRILDSKNEADRLIIAGAPRLGDYFNDASRAHFAAVQAGLNHLEIPYKISDTLVRGLDYYSHTVFEFTTDKLGAQGTILAGGRYDGLVSLMGGPDISGVGFGAGIERWMMLLEGMELTAPPPVVVIPMQPELEAKGFALVQQLRAGGIAAEIAYKGNSKKRFERANKIGAAFAVIIGEDELARGECTLKNLTTGHQQSVAHEALISLLKSGD